MEARAPGNARQRAQNWEAPITGAKAGGAGGALAEVPRFQGVALLQSEAAGDRTPKAEGVQPRLTEKVVDRSPSGRTAAGQSGSTREMQKA